MSTLYANFHHDRHRQTAGQHIQPEKKPRAVQMHAAKKIDAEHNPLIPADHHATASTHTNLRYAPSGFTLLPITDYAQEIMGAPDANRPARVKNPQTPANWAPTQTFRFRSPLGGDTLFGPVPGDC